jgi:hypothetical protein
MKIYSTLILLLSSLLVLTAQEVEITGKAKITLMDQDNNANNVVVKMADGTLGLRQASTLINDADANTTNEIQSLSLNGNTLGLSLGGGSVSLANFASPWLNSGSNLYFNTGKVGIGDNSPIATLTVGLGDKFQVHGADGDVVFKDDQGSIRFANSNGSNAPMLQMFASGTNNSTRMLVAHSPSYQNWGIMYNDTADAFNFVSSSETTMHIGLNDERVGIGTQTPQAKLHILENSFPGQGHIKLTETATDDARITFENETYPEHWDIAASPGPFSSTSYMRFNYNNETNSPMTIRGSGQIGINDAIPSYPLEINGNGATRTINIYNELAPTTSSSSRYGIRCNLSQQPNTGAPRLLSIYGYITDTDADISYGVYGLAQGAETNSYGIFGKTPTTDGYAGYFNGNVFSTGTYTPSDPKLKTNINEMATGLDKIMTLTPITYHYKIDAFPELNFENRMHYGFNAEEIEQTLPELINQTYQPIEEPVSDREEDRGTWFKAVNYQGMIPILTKAIQEQQEIISTLQNRIEQLEVKLKE